MGAEGREILAAFKKASAWGTAASVGALNGILLLTDSTKKTQPPLPDESAGQAFTLTADRGNIAVTGAPTAYLRYDGLMEILALLFGTAGTPAQQGGTAAYKHILQLATDTDGKFGTYAVSKVTEIQEAPSIKILGITLSGEMGKEILAAIDWVADDLVIPATVNTSLASVTYRDRGNRVLFSQAVFRLNAQSGAALASPTDVIKPASFELKIARPMAGEYLAGNANKIDSPTGTGFPSITLSLRFPIYSASTWTAALAGDIRKKLDLTFTGALISGIYYRALTFIFPHLQLDDTDTAFSGPGKIPNPVSFIAHAASSAPTGMSYTLPVTLEAINTQTTDPLA
jgi:hypothetical protein